MASEFYVLSTLYRMGLEPLLTLGNKKGVDIYLPQDGSEMLSIEVKAVAKRMDWMFGDREFISSARKWVVLLCYNGAFENLEQPPEAWVLPSSDIAHLIKVAGNEATRYLPAKLVRESCEAFKDAAGWSQLRANSG